MHADAFASAAYSQVFNRRRVVGPLAALATLGSDYASEIIQNSVHDSMAPLPAPIPATSHAIALASLPRTGTP